MSGPGTSPPSAAPSRAQLGAVLVCLAAALWGLDGVVLTPRLAALPVQLVVFLLHALPFLLMAPILGRRCWPRLAALGPSGWTALLAVSLCGGLIGTLAIVHALFLVGFRQLSIVVLLQKLQPLFALGLAALVLGERLSARLLGWAAAAVAGAYVMTFGLGLPDFQGGAVNGRAAFWALVAAAAFGAATVLGKRLLGATDVVTATVGRYGVTTALAALTLVVSGVGFPLAAVGGREWTLLVVIALTTGSGAIFLYYVGLSRIRASVATLCELCLPLSAVILDHLVNGSRLAPSQWLGAALLVTAIARVSLLKEQPGRAGEGER